MKLYNYYEQLLEGLTEDERKTFNPKQKFSSMFKAQGLSTTFASPETMGFFEQLNDITSFDAKLRLSDCLGYAFAPFDYQKNPAFEFDNALKELNFRVCSPETTFIRPELTNVRSCHAILSNHHAMSQFAYLANPYWGCVYFYAPGSGSAARTDYQISGGVNLPGKTVNSLSNTEKYRTLVNSLVDGINVLASCNIVLGYDSTTWERFIGISRIYGDISQVRLQSLVKYLAWKYKANVGIVQSGSNAWTDNGVLAAYWADSGLSRREPPTQLVNLYTPPVRPMIELADDSILYRYPDIAKVQVEPGTNRIQERLPMAVIFRHPNPYVMNFKTPGAKEKFLLYKGRGQDGTHYGALPKLNMAYCWYSHEFYEREEMIQIGTNGCAIHQSYLNQTPIVNGIPCTLVRVQFYNKAYYGFGPLVGRGLDRDESNEFSVPPLPNGLNSLDTPVLYLTLSDMPIDTELPGLEIQGKSPTAYASVQLVGVKDAPVIGYEDYRTDTGVIKRFKAMSTLSQYLSDSRFRATISVAKVGDVYYYFMNRKVRDTFFQLIKGMDVGKFNNEKADVKQLLLAYPNLAGTQRIIKKRHPEDEMPMAVYQFLKTMGISGRHKGTPIPGMEEASLDQSVGEVVELLEEGTLPVEGEVTRVPIG